MIRVKIGTESTLKVAPYTHRGRKQFHSSGKLKHLELCERSKHAHFVSRPQISIEHRTREREHTYTRGVTTNELWFYSANKGFLLHANCTCAATARTPFAYSVRTSAQASDKHNSTQVEEHV